MRSFCFLCWSALFFLLVPSVQGHIGQSLDQCRKQYGESSQVQPEVLTFKTDGLSLIITFYAGRADAVVYRKLEIDDAGNPVELSAAEIGQLLQANAGGRVWKKATTELPDSTWETDDGELSARYTAAKHYLAILTKGYAERAEEAEKSNSSFGLKNF